MRIFKTKDFTRFARKEGMTDAQLRAAVKGAARNPDAALGGEVFKQRIARPGAGKSGGYRTIIVLRGQHRAQAAAGPEEARTDLSRHDRRRDRTPH